MAITENKMDLAPIFEAQGELDGMAFKNAHESRESTFDRRILATVAEIVEVMDEIPVLYKYWKREIKNPHPDRVKDELADVFHFIVSIGIDVGAGKDKASYYITRYDTPQEQLRHLIAGTTALQHGFDWQGVMALFRGLYDMLGLSDQGMIDAYNVKNAENRDRQKRGY